MPISPQNIAYATDVAKAAVSSGEKAGLQALNHPEDVAKLIETVAKKIQELYGAQ